MKIYTKQGDKGNTSLFGGKRLPKDHMRIDTYGTMDELNSYLGVVRDHVDDASVESVIVKIQEDIFTISSWIAADPDRQEKLQLPEFDEGQIDFLEKTIDEYNENLPEMKNFILPGGHQGVSFCHVARCVCRRAERKLVALNHNEQCNPSFVKYINRLSDYLFVLSRKVSFDNKSEETPWKPF